MRRALVLLWILAFAAAAAAPAGATSVTVQMTGTWDSVIDNAGVTNGSITTGGSFTVTLTYDDAISDIDPDPTVGSYLLPAASSFLMLTTGSYTFTLLASEGVLFGVSDDWFEQDDFGFFAENFTTVGPLPLGVSTGFGFMNPIVVDSTQTAHSSDALTGLPWSVGDYDSPNLAMNFLIAVNGAGTDKKIDLLGEFTEFTVLPEPALLTLAGLGAALLLGARLRG